MHLWLGIVSAIVLIIVSITGALLVFEDELELFFFHKIHHVKVLDTRCSLDKIIQTVHANYDEHVIEKITIQSDDQSSLEILVSDENSGIKQLVYVDPYTGSILYSVDKEHRFFEIIQQLHRYLLLGKIGKVITGISCCICLSLVVSGLYLWWPPNKKAIKHRLRIKWDARIKRINWDLHAVSGFYLSIILLLIMATGLVWSYQWIDQSIYLLLDGTGKKVEKVTVTPSNEASQIGIFQQMLEQINAQYSYEGETIIRIPRDRSLAISIQKKASESILRKVDQLYFDRVKGQIVQAVNYEDLSFATKVRRMVYPIHTGSLLGWPTKILYLIVCLFTSSLPVTGIFIKIGKLKKYTFKKKSKYKPA